jgi:predicted nucleic acid-binding protein
MRERHDLMALFHSIHRILVAADTGPLLSAFQAGCTELLRRYFSTIFIVQSQLAEFQKHGSAAEIQRLIDDGLVFVITTLTDEEKIEALEVARRIAATPSCRDSVIENHLPEAELMIVSRRVELQCDRILLDEKAARAVAEAMGLQITGFLGILARAGLDGLLTKDQIRTMLQTCQRLGTHYSNNLVDLIVNAYGR